MILPNDWWIYVWSAWVATQIDVLHYNVDTSRLAYWLRKLADTSQSLKRRHRVSKHFISCFTFVFLCVYLILCYFMHFCEMNRRVGIHPLKYKQHHFGTLNTT